MDVTQAQICATPKQECKQIPPPVATNYFVTGQIYAGRSARAGAKFPPAEASIFVFSQIYAGRNARADAIFSFAEARIRVF